MLSKLLKYDLRKNMRWLWIIFVATIVVAGIDRGCKELSEKVAFFKIISIILDSVFYALAVNCILQPFLRGFFNFSKSFYSDESYLTHTLPVTKQQLINSKYITSLIEVVLGFISLVFSILIMYASPTMLDTLKFIFSAIVVGDISVVCVLVLFVLLVLIEFLMFLSIIYFSIVLANKQKEKRVLKTFMYTAGFAFASMSVLSIIMVVVMLACGVDLTVSTLILSKTAFFSIFVTGIVVYLMVAILFYFLTKREFGKGVNVD